MTLYRLDYVDTEGKVTGAVQGWHIDVLTMGGGGDVLTRHMTTARQHALNAARRAECDVQIAGIIKGGQIKARLVVHPDGSARKPGGAKSTNDCKAGSGQNCWCPVCRAKRRDQRHTTRSQSGV